MHSSVVARLPALVLGPALLLSGCGLDDPQSRKVPPREVAPLADLVARRDAVVAELLTELSGEDPRSPAMGNRFRALKWLGELRARDEKSVEALVEQMCAAGVPEILFGSERDFESYYPATDSLRTLRGLVDDELLVAGMQSTDPLRHRLTAWVLRYTSRLGGTRPSVFVSQVDRSFDFRHHHGAVRILDFIRNPPIDTEPPQEIAAARLEPGSRTLWKETPADWVDRAKNLVKEIRDADEWVPALVEKVRERYEAGGTREWALWLGGQIVRSEEVVSSRAPDRWLAWLPRGGRSLACDEPDPEWEKFFPYAVFASRTGPGSGTEWILRATDRDDSPLLVDLATWVVVQALGREVGSAALRTWARSEQRDLGVSRRLHAAAERAASWKARPVPPADVLREIKMSSWAFRRLCK